MKRVWLSLFVVGLMLVGNDVASAVEGQKLTLEDVWKSSKFRAQSVRGLRSMNDGLHYTSLDSDRGGQAINKYAYSNGKKVETLVNAVDLVPDGGKGQLRIGAYQFSADESKVLISTDIEQIYRHSTRETNYVYDIKSKKLSLLYEGPKQRYATFSPAGDKVAFVSKNNLFVTDLGSGETIQITIDGKENELIHGATDWVYEEEFAFDKAFFWSPDGKRIAYYTIDEKRVREFNMPMYGELYPRDYKFKYPKAGEDNSFVQIRIHDMEKNQPEEVSIDASSYEYIPRVKWTANPEVLAVMTMPRLQNKLDIHYVHAPSGEARVVYTESSDTYIDINDNINFINGETAFFLTSERNGYNHIYLNNLNGGGLKQITKGKWVVDELLGVNQENELIYYTSSEDSPMERHLYSIKFDGSEKTKITTKKGTNRISFSKGFKYFINYHTDANTPTFVSLHKADGKQIRVLVDNERLLKTLKEYDLSPKEFYSFKTPDDVELNGWMIKPPNFDKKKKYPVLMHVYGGPGSQTVRDSWGGNYMWHQYMAQQGYIIISVDNRGTGARGREFKNCTYKQLGNLETQDQIFAAQYLKTLPFVDESRIGIWGWSYGGYMSSLCITKGAADFKAAVAVAPVSNWRYYDSIYTERYMATPQENADGYDDNSPINHVEKLEGAYLLVHGSGDDNVHFQNAVEMVNALIKADKHFDFYMYPDRNHGIYGGNTRYHLFTKISTFIEENL